MRTPTSCYKTDKGYLAAASTISALSTAMVWWAPTYVFQAGATIEDQYMDACRIFQKDGSGFNPMLGTRIAIRQMTGVDICAANSGLLSIFLDGIKEWILQVKSVIGGAALVAATGVTAAAKTAWTLAKYILTFPKSFIKMLYGLSQRFANVFRKALGSYKQYGCVVCGNAE